MERTPTATLVSMTWVLPSLLLVVPFATGCEYPAALFAPCDDTSDCPVRHYCSGDKLCVRGCPAQDCGVGPRGEQCGSCSGGAYCDVGRVCRVAGCPNGACESGESISSCPADCRVVAVMAGLSSTCLLFQGGVLRCFGDNSRGQLGDGRELGILMPSRTVLLPAPAVAIAPGERHACALLRNGTLWCWGANDEGQLGDASATDRHRPVRALLPEPALAMALGGGHSCAIGVSTSLYCWGRNTYGQVGNGVGGSFHTPVKVSGLTQVVSLALGKDHTCATNISGSLYCWGRNHEGQLGIGVSGLQAAPVAVTALGDVEAAAAGSNTCAIQRSGALSCWGGSQYGGVGDGTTQTHSIPWMVPTVAHVTRVSVSDHTCVGQADGAVRCWGRNDSGQLGIGSSGLSVLSPPLEPLDLPPVAGIAAGGQHTCALLSDGTVACWGDNSSGQLGIGNNLSQVRPALVVGQH